MWAASILTDILLNFLRDSCEARGARFRLTLNWAKSH
jgi:hypothetical protein